MKSSKPMLDWESTLLTVVDAGLAIVVTELVALDFEKFEDSWSLELVVGVA